jgi:hypothetical protein
MSRLRTWRGKTISVLTPTAAEVHVADIVTPLFRIVRFSGHTSRPWTVGEHTILALLIAKHCSPLVSQQELTGILLHDLHEAYIGDIPRPIARCLKGLPDLRERFDAAIYEALGFPLEHRHAGYWDDMTLAWELANLTWKRTSWSEACDSVRVLPPAGCQIPHRQGGVDVINGQVWMAGVLRAMKNRDGQFVNEAFAELPTLQTAVASGKATLKLPREATAEAVTEPALK